MFSLVLPAYNEAPRIEKCVEIAARMLHGQKFEIIIAEDGSTDGTDEIGAKLSKKRLYVRHFHSDKKLGRGRALKQAFEQAKGDFVGYMDVDLATNPKHLLELVEHVKKYDVVTGSRYLPDSNAKRSNQRALLSSGYNLLVRILTGSKLYDHQCGFKAFKKKAILELNSLSRENHWSWDTEVLVLAQHLGYSVKEFPVEWKEQKQTTVNLKRDVIDMAASVLKLWWRILTEKIG